MAVPYRWASVTPDDYSGALYVVTFLGFTYSSITFLTRIYIKWRRLGLDDAAMLAAQVASIIQFALLLTSLSAGLSKTFGLLTQKDYLRVASTEYRVQVVVYLSLGLSKLSTILLVQRLFPEDMRSARLTCNVVTSAIVLWTLAAALLVSVGCSAEGLSPKTSSQICSGIESRYLVVVATDAITDSILALLPAFLCRNLQMRLEFKLQVLGVFALRLPLLPLAVLFFKSWKASLHSSNPGVARTAPLIYQQIQLCYSLIASTIPCLRSFLQSFDTGSGFKAGFGSSTDGYPCAWRSIGRPISTVPTDNSQSYEMNGYPPNRKCTSSARNEAYGENSIVNRMSFNTNGGFPAADDSVDSKRRSTQESDRRSHQSTQELFIRKDVKWEVSRERVRRGSDVNSPGMLRIPKY